MNKNSKNKDLALVNSANILDTKTIKKLRTIEKELEHGFIIRQRFRPRFLMEVSVLNDMKFPTPDSKYWQCNLERDTHFKNLVELSFNYKEKIADIHILEAELHELEQSREGKEATIADYIARNPPINEINEAKIEKKNIQIQHEENSLTFMKKEAYERVREIMNWTDIMCQLSPKLKYSKDNPEEHMPESYSLRFAREREAMQTAGRENAAHDLAGAMNIISLAKTAFDNPSVLFLIEEEKKQLGGDKNSNHKKISGKQQS